jgi:hypothetical protein
MLRIIVLSLLITVVMGCYPASYYGYWNVPYSGPYPDWTERDYHYYPYTYYNPFYYYPYLFFPFSFSFNYSYGRYDYDSSHRFRDYYWNPYHGHSYPRR